MALLIKLYNTTYLRLVDNTIISDNHGSILAEKYYHERRTRNVGAPIDEKVSIMLDNFFPPFSVYMVYKGIGRCVERNNYNIKSVR